MISIRKSVTHDGKCRGEEVGYAADLLIDAETGRPVPGTEVKIDPLPVLSATSIDTGVDKINELAPRVPTQEELEGKGKEKLSKLNKKALKDMKNPLSSSQLQAFAGNILSFIKK